MSLLRTRPSIRLRAPRDVVPGAPFEITVLLDAKKAVEIEWCEVTIVGTEYAGKAQAPVMPMLEARVSGALDLAVGTTTLPCRITLPADVPRSKPGPGACVLYTVAVHASIPWWPDARAQFSLHVVAPRGEPAVGDRRVAVSRIEGPVPGEPYAELSIGTDVVELGGVIDARVALRDVGTARTKLSLVAYDTYPNGSVRIGAWSIPTQVEQSIAFRVPDDITPSMRARWFALEYRLVAEAHGTFSPLVTASLPIRVVDPGAARDTSRIVAPHVGDARLEELFASVAATENVMLEPGPALVARRGRVEGRATRELGRDGARIAVRVTYPSLHLDLHVHERSLLALTGRARRLAREAGLGARCVVSARDDDQAAELLKRVAARTERARSIEMNDTELRYDVVTPVNDRQTVGRVVRDMSLLVDILALPVTMPTAIAGATSAWEQLARELGGTLEPGHARVTASIDESEIEVQTTFDLLGAPDGTVVWTRLARELRIERPITHGGGALPGDLAIAPEARAAIERLGEIGAVHVEARSIRVILDAPLGLGVPVLRAKEAIDGALRLAVAMRPTSGPFR